jgi:glycosyltransferase involved in cell wall biosynthesis
MTHLEANRPAALERIAEGSLNVLYDISVLGLGHHGLSRAGIFRVVEELAKGLSQSDCCQLNFCSSVSLDLNVKSRDYLDATPGFRDVPFRSRVKLAGVYRSLSRRFTAVASGSVNTFEKRARRKFLGESLRLLDRCCDGLPDTALEEIDIFHSPHHRFPKSVSASTRVKRFLTIYDLIPILAPQFFQFKGEHMVKTIVDAIHPEDWIVAISEATKRDLCEYRKDLDPERVFVTPLAASDSFYPEKNLERIAETKKRYGIPAGRYFLSLSTLEPRKNIAQTIRCFAKLVTQEKLDDLSLVLVGAKGWDFSEILELSDSSVREKVRVILPGFVPDQDLAAVYSGATAFIYPSFYEGFGLPPLEAMKCGIPVITSNTSSLPEVVGDAGLMVAPTDSDALCQSMLSLYRSPALRAEIAAKCLERASAFSWAKTTAQTLAAYRAAAESG